MGAFHVCLSYSSDWAMVHRSECYHARNAKPPGDRRSPNTSKWLGPFDLREEAFKRAREAMLKSVGTCGICKPQGAHAERERLYLLALSGIFDQGYPERAQALTGAVQPGTAMTAKGIAARRATAGFAANLGMRSIV